MADQRTMAQLLQAPTEGYEDAIVVPAITADNFELKHGLLTFVQNKQFFRHEKEDPHAHVRYFNKITSTLKFPNVLNMSIKLMLFPFSLEGAAWIWLEKEPPRSIFTWDDLVSKFINQFFPPSKTTNLRNEITHFQQRFDESFSEAWDRFKDLIRACPHHGFLKLHQLDTFYNALNSKYQDSLNSAASGDFLDKMPRECLDILESKSKVCYSRNKLVIAKVSTNTSTSGISPDVAELKDIVKALLLDKKNQNQSPAPMKAVEESCHNMQNQLTDLITKFVKSNSASTSSLGTLSSNTIANTRSDLKAITTRSGLAECLALSDVGASINLMLILVWKGLSLLDLTPTCMTLELADRLISRPVGVAEDVYVKVGSFHFPADFVVVDFDADPRVPLILGRLFLKTERALIDVFEGELTLRVGKEAITFNLDQTSRYSANYSDMTAKHIDPYLDPEGDILLLESFLNDDLSLPPPNQRNYLPEVHKELKICEAKSHKSSVDEPLAVELIDLPPYLEYAFFEGDDKLPIIIAKDLSVEEKIALITVLKSHKLCNAPSTFQRCMMAIFNDMIEKTIEVFMDDFFVFGNSFQSCLSHLERMQKRCEDTNLCLNWEKNHFMVKEGIVLTHKISKQRIKVDKAKVDVITKLPHPTTVKGENRVSWSNKLDDALWVFHTAYMTPIECTLYKLVYKKACHLPVGLEHKAYWALKHANFDLKTAVDHRKVQINELNELHDQAYENSLVYKEKTKRLHDSKIKNRVFNIGDIVFLFNFRLKIFSRKFKSRWSGPFTISQFYLYATVELSQPDGLMSKSMVIVLSTIILERTY
nr:reverse transcriptase domain-containing protein [Tanacetum cinerariifolium]